VNAQMLDMLNEAKEMYGDFIKYAGVATSWEECFTTFNNTIIFWFNVGTDTRNIQKEIKMFDINSLEDRVYTKEEMMEAFKQGIDKGVDQELNRCLIQKNFEHNIVKDQLKNLSYNPAEVKAELRS